MIICKIHDLIAKFTVTAILIELDISEIFEYRALKNLTTLSALWCFYLDVSLSTSVFLFTIAFIPSLQTSLQSVGQLKSSHNSGSSSGFPCSGFRDPHRPLDHTLRTTDPDLYPE